MPLGDNREGFCCRRSPFVAGNCTCLIVPGGVNRIKDQREIVAGRHAIDPHCTVVECIEATKLGPSKAKKWLQVAAGRHNRTASFIAPELSEDVGVSVRRQLIKETATNNLASVSNPKI